MDQELDLIRRIQQLSSQEFQQYYENETDNEVKLALLRCRCATDRELFATTFFPHYCTREFNSFHHYVFQTIQYGEKDVRRASAAPRGSAKSTLGTLINPLHDVCYGNEKFIVIISSTTPLANKKLKDIRNEVQQNRALFDVYGIRFSRKKVGESEFNVVTDHYSCYFAAVGRGSEVRGIRIGAHRPTKFILDDVEFSEEVYNPKTRAKTAEWYFEDVVKAGDTGTNFEFIGTVLHKDSLLAKLLRNPAYKGKTFKSIISWSEREDLWNEWRKIYRDLDDPARLEKSNAFYEKNKDEMLKGTKVMWPEKEDYLFLMKEIEEIGMRSFMKEKQNDPQGTDDSIFNKFHWYKEMDDGLHILETGKTIPWRDLTCFAAMDPATGQERKKASGDFSVIIVAYKHISSRRIFLHFDWTKRAAPTTYISKIFELHEKFKFERFAVETNLYRNLLMPNILAEKKAIEEKMRKQNPNAANIVLNFYDVENTENKMERIYRLEPKVTHGEILFNKALSREFLQMFENFPNDDHDDSPDATEMLYNLCNNRYKSVGVNISALSGH